MQGNVSEGKRLRQEWEKTKLLPGCPIQIGEFNELVVTFALSSLCIFLHQTGGKLSTKITNHGSNEMKSHQYMLIYEIQSLIRKYLQSQSASQEKYGREKT
jgi:hypothetical protein